jgi:hypothetical protein
MANIEVGKVFPLYSASTGTCVIGVGNIASSASAPINGTSVIRSIVRTTKAGGDGVPTAKIIAPTGTVAGAVWSIQVNSTSATDTSTYSVYWVNEYQASPNFVQGVAATAAPCQFAP